MTPTSATGSSRRPAGFSLVELLVVVAMIGLLGSAVLLTLPPTAPRAGEQGERLAAHLARAREEAVLGNRAVAVRVERDGYRFLKRQGGGWQALDAPPFHPRRFADGITASFRGNADVARFEFDATGGASATDVLLGDDAGKVRLVLDAAGEVALHAAR